MYNFIDKKGPLKICETLRVPKRNPFHLSNFDSRVQSITHEATLEPYSIKLGFTFASKFQNSTRGFMSVIPNFKLHRRSLFRVLYNPLIAENNVMLIKLPYEKDSNPIDLIFST
jgi:hypothetical protein